MADTKFDVPIWHKTNLTVEEAQLIAVSAHRN